MARTYKIRRFTNGQSKGGKEFTNYSLTVPASIASKLPDEMQFECALTDDGILFRPVTNVEEQVELPNWAQTDVPANGRAARKRPAAQAA